MTKTKFTASPKQQAYVSEREFDIPAETLFKAFTDAKIIAQWWGAEGLTGSVDRLDARAGGSWRFVDSDQAGNDYAFRGVYHEAINPTRIVRTFEFEGWPGQVMLETLEFTDLGGGRTRLTATSVFQSTQARDEMLATGAEEGAEQTWSRLEKLLAS